MCLKTYTRLEICRFNQNFQVIVSLMTGNSKKKKKKKKCCMFMPNGFALCQTNPFSYSRETYNFMGFWREYTLPSDGYTCS